MKKIAVGVVGALMVLVMLRLLVVNAGPALAPARSAEWTRRLDVSPGPTSLRSSEELTPTGYLPLVLSNSPDPNYEPPTVQFNSSGHSVHEGAGEAKIIVTLSAASDKTVHVSYATSDGTAEAGSDYVATSGALTFSPGQTSQAFTVTVNDDPYDELDERVNLGLSNPINAVLGVPSAATLTIVDNDERPTVQFNSGSYSVYEDAGEATIIATLSAAPDVTVTVDYATSDGTADAGSDYVAISGTLTFSPGKMNQAFTVTVNGDAFDEPDETVNLSLSNPINAVLGTPHTATLTIADSDKSLTVQFNSSTYSAYEEAGEVTIIATLSAAPDVTVSVDYATSDGAAEAGEDYAGANGTLTFAPGQASQAINLELFNDPFDELDETFTITLSSPVNATLGTPNSAVLTIVDEDVPSRFGLQSAALHEFTPDTLAQNYGVFVIPQTEDEWYALLQSAYVTLTAALRDSGAGWSRVRVEWEIIEHNEPMLGQPPDYRWAWHDAKLRLVAEAGVRLIGTVVDAPDWAASVPCGPIYPERLDEFARFLTDLVNHYKGPPYYIRHWELLNEPDYDGSEGYETGWSCWGNDPDRYAQMLAIAYPAIKAADPEATVIMGGLAYDRFTEYGGPFLRYFPDEVMQNGGGAFIDALNLHYFPDFHDEWERWTSGNPPTCGIVDDGVGTPYEAWGIDLIAKTKHLRNRMHTCFGVDKPVWVTEIGEHGFAGASSLAEQARYVIQGNARGLAAGAEHITWYALNAPNDPWAFELLFDDWTPKPAFYAYQTLTSELGGYEHARTLDVPNVEGYVFEDPSLHEKTVAWGSGTLSFTPADQLRVVDRQGTETFVEDGGPGDVDGSLNGAVELQLSADPVFVAVSD